MTEAEILKSLRNLKRLACFMDAGWGIPFTRIRFGADSIIGLVPGAGDLVGLAASLYMVKQARALGAPNDLLMRMLVNVAIDSGIGAIPVVGDVFDVFFKSNLKNIDMLTVFLRQKGINIA